MRPASLLNAWSFRDCSTMTSETFSRSTELGSNGIQGSILNQTPLWSILKPYSIRQKAAGRRCPAVTHSWIWHSPSRTFERRFQQLLGLRVEGLDLVVLFGRILHDGLRTIENLKEVRTDSQAYANTHTQMQECMNANIKHTETNWVRQIPM